MIQLSSKVTESKMSLVMDSPNPLDVSELRHPLLTMAADQGGERVVCSDDRGGAPYAHFRDFQSKLDKVNINGVKLCASKNQSS